ncbi:MFS transporter, partial [Bacillus pseudomycoides]|nr:MFS transporter [Bacillus pseudomycoides]
TTNVVTKSQEVLASSAHIIDTSTDALALLTLFIEWLLLKPPTQTTEQ